MWHPPKFRRPPPCPVFEPTEEQFKDPLAFISSIRAEGEKYGMVKVRPPPSFQPPFALNIEEFKFRPRRQRVNELSACTRVRQNFLDKLVRFWELQGITLKIPRVENELLCLYTLHQAVTGIGGFSKCCQDKNWGKLAADLGYTSKAGAGSALRLHYEKILYPFDVLTQHLKPESQHPCRRTLPNKASVIRNAMSQTRTKTEPISISKQNIKDNKELAKLQLFGAGPKMRGLGIYPTDDSAENDVRRSRRRDLTKSPQKSSPKKSTDVDLSCVKCGSVHKMADLLPKLFEIPRGDWHCPPCLQLHTPALMSNEKFGFEQSERVYNLREFGERADEFKREYFGLPPHHMEVEKVEEEFWRMVDDIEGDVTVEYGADIQALEKGSGFSSRFNPPHSIDDPVYRAHPWNLVNLPVAKKSVLQYIEGDISGVKVPWLYVGMCFSAFAWHTEDHWTYSINYHHFGEPKIWYSSSHVNADRLEEVYREEAAELYIENRDLMHHITTTISPGLLLDRGVDVYRAVQCPGEFMITFPRGYHAGFNAGLNLAEAVNFCPPDWISIGRMALANYRLVQRYNIFSQDELILKIAKESVEKNSVEGSIVTLAHKDLQFMIDRESKERSDLLKLIKPTTRNVRIKKDLFCGLCQTAVYCSYVMFDRRCDLQLNDAETYDVPETFVDQGIDKGRCQLMCLLCAKQKLSDVDIKPSHVNLMVHWEIDDMKKLCYNTKNSIVDYENWEVKIKNFSEKSGTLEEFRKFLTHGAKYDTTRMFQQVRQTVEEAEKAQGLVHEVFDAKTRPCLSREDLSSFCDKIKNFPFQLEKTNLLLEELSKADSVLDELRDDDLSFTTCEVLIAREKSLKLDIIDMKRIRELQKVIEFLPKIAAKYRSIDDAKKVVDEGSTLLGMEYNKTFLSRFKGFEADLELAVRYEANAAEYLDADDFHDLKEIEDFLDNIRHITEQIQLEQCTELDQEYQKSSKWLKKYHKYFKSNSSTGSEPSLHVAKALLDLSDDLAIQPSEVSNLRTKIQKAEEWLDKLRKVFLKKGWFWTLQEVLLPRTEELTKISFKDLKDRKKKVKELEVKNVRVSDDGFFEDFKRLSSEEIWRLERNELKLYNQTRTRNSSKLKNESATYCICQRGAKSLMYPCELCGEWIHSLCLPRRNQSPMDLCSRCIRSRRPSLHFILPVLVELQAQELHIEEADYLQALIERVVRWQSEYKCLVQKIDDTKTKNDSERNSQLLVETQNLFIESLLLEVNLEESVNLKERMRSRWTHLNIPNPPQGAELAEHHLRPSSDQKNRRKREKEKSETLSKPERKSRKKIKIDNKDPDDDDEDEDGDDDIDDDGPCAAAHCIHPDGDEVDWICCDKCIRWFHCACVGLTPQEAQAENEYACLQCHRRATS